VQPRRHLHFYDTEDIDAEAAGRHPSVIFTSADDVQDNRGSMEACGMVVWRRVHFLDTCQRRW
jgi:hypothetical protein